MNTKWFQGFTDSKESLKKRYYALVRQYHPDIVGHDTTEIREINNEYDHLYDLILNGGVVISVYDKPKPTATPLIAYHICLFIRNRYIEDLNRMQHEMDVDTDFGKYIHATREVDFDGWFHRQVLTKTVYVMDPPKDMKPGFYVCEIFRKPMNPNAPSVTIEIARIIEDKTFEPASMEDIYDMITSGKTPWSEFKPDDDVFRGTSWIPHFTHTIRRYDPKSIYAPSSHECIYTATSKNYGDIVYKIDGNHSSRHVNCVTVYFKMDGILYESQVIEKQLGPLENVQKYTPEDIVVLHKFGYNSEELFNDADFCLSDICVTLGFSRDDIVRDWPLDPVLSRYVRLNVITVYRHGYQMYGHFNGDALYSAIVLNKIDLEDFDLCQKQFDDWYNDCLAKFKRDVKRGRIRITD